MLNIKQLLTDDDAVSPVIGVILMVAITVILAAVIAAFVLGIGDSTAQSSPQATFSFDFDSTTTADNCNGNLEDGSNDGVLDITHEGGDTVNENRLSLKDDDTNDITDLENCDSITADGQDVSAGTTISPDINDADTLRITWSDQSGDNSATIGEWEAPNA